MANNNNKNLQIKEGDYMIIKHHSNTEVSIVGVYSDRQIAINNTNPYDKNLSVNRVNSSAGNRISFDPITPNSTKGLISHGVLITY